MTEQEPTNSGDVMVCTDCYFAHHYGCTPCTHCKRADYDNGLYEFSWSSCQGCGSGLGGARYRLHWTERTSS